MTAYPDSATGFAYNPEESQNPRLWDRNVLCAAPCLGIGGPRNLPDLSPSRWDAAFNSVAGTYGGGSPIGPTVRLNGTNASLQWTANSAGLPTKIGTGIGNPITLTIQVYFRYVHKASSNHNFLYRSDANPSVLTPTFHGWGLYVEANTDDLVLFSNTAGALTPDKEYQWRLATSPSPGTFTALTGGKWHHVIVTYDSNDLADPDIGQYVMMCIDGQWIYPGTPVLGEIGAVHSLTKHAKTGSVISGTSTTPDFELALLNVWARRLPWQEIDQLMVDPRLMFRRRVSPVSPSIRMTTIGGTALRQVKTIVGA